MEIINMIQAIKHLGEQKLKRENRDISKLFSILVQDPNQDNRYPNVLVIVFKKENSDLIYSGDIEIEETAKSKIEKYLYRRGSSNGPNFTPTAIITDISKTFKTKILGWFNWFNSKSNQKQDKDLMESGQDVKIVQLLSKEIKNKAEKIKKDLSQKWDEIKPQLMQNRKGGIMTLGIKEADKQSYNYLGDYDIFKELLMRLVKAKYKKIVKSNHTCSICGEKRDEVFGAAIPFPFYTLDKPGYIAGGFNKENAWKNAPTCFGCSLKLEEGKKYLDENLKLKMAGHQFYLIPQFIFETQETEEVVKVFPTAYNQQIDTLDEQTLQAIPEDEKEMLRMLGEYNDVLTYNFLFFSTPTKSTFKIDLLIEDIPPSRLNRIYQVIIEAEDNDVFKDVKIKKNKYENIKFRFDVLKKFIPSPQSFFDVLDKIFCGVSLDSELFFSWVMSRIRQNFIKGSYLKSKEVLEALISFMFLKKLGLLPQKQIFYQGGEIMTELIEKAEGFFNSFPNTFTTSAHKFVFLLGVLCQKLLDIQYQERRAKPFLKHLRGLRMKEQDLKALLPKIQNKLEEYGKNYYRSLEELISVYGTQAGRDWKINTDELNFFFVLGMNLAEKVEEKLKLTKQ